MRATASASGSSMRWLAALALIAAIAVGATIKLLSTHRITSAASWSVREYAGLSIDLPAELKADPAPQVPAGAHDISRSENYRAAVAGCSVGLSRTEYASTRASTEAAVAASMEAVKMRYGDRNVKMVPTEMDIDGVHGIKLVMHIRQDNVEATTVTLYLAVRRELWMISVGGERLQATEMARRIFASLKWKA